jgi:hypothetical protein
MMNFDGGTRPDSRNVTRRPPDPNKKKKQKKNDSKLTEENVSEKILKGARFL